jgi:hypothetical protein
LDAHYSAAGFRLDLPDHRLAPGSLGIDNIMPGDLVSASLPNCQISGPVSSTFCSRHGRTVGACRRTNGEDSVDDR